MMFTSDEPNIVILIKNLEAKSLNGQKNESELQKLSISSLRRLFPNSRLKTLH